jgi:hypothetical protein
MVLLLLICLDHARPPPSSVLLRARCAEHATLGAFALRIAAILI